MFCVDNDEEGMKALSYLLKCLEARGKTSFQCKKSTQKLDQV